MSMKRARANRSGLLLKDKAESTSCTIADTNLCKCVESAFTEIKIVGFLLGFGTWGLLVPYS